MNTTTSAPTFSPKQFDRCSDIKSFSQDASALGLQPGQPPHGQLFAKPNAQGMILQGARKGDCSVWVLDAVDKSGDDVAGWKFKPTVATLLLFPHLAGWTVLVVND